MTLTPAQFRADFPEFADTTAYPDAQIAAELALGATYINEDRWGALATRGAELVAAHFLVLAKRDQTAPGLVQGVQSSKSVADLSVSYDNASVMNPNDGFWNLTSYGLRYRSLVRLVGAGGMQLI